MEYQPFDFDKLDALLRECEALSGDSPPPDKEPSGHTRPTRPIDDGFGDPDPFSGWPTLKSDASADGPQVPPAEPDIPAAHPSRESAALRRITESSPRRRRYEVEAPQSKPRKKSSSGRRRAEPDPPSFRRWRREAEDEPPRRRRYEPPEPDELEGDDWETPPRKKKKHRFLKVLLVLILILAGSLFAILKFNLFQPTADSGTLGARKTGASTILIAGTDDGGSRTDTMMLVYVNAVSGELNLISIPRDTLVNASYNVPKLNACYGVNGGGEEGMEALMDKVQAIIGFRRTAMC